MRAYTPTFPRSPHIISSIFLYISALFPPKRSALLASFRKHNMFFLATSMDFVLVSINLAFQSIWWDHIRSWDPNQGHRPRVEQDERSHTHNPANASRRGTESTSVHIQQSLVRGHNQISYHSVMYMITEITFSLVLNQGNVTKEVKLEPRCYDRGCLSTHPGEKIYFPAVFFRWGVFWGLFLDFALDKTPYWTYWCTLFIDSSKCCKWTRAPVSNAFYFLLYNMFRHYRVYTTHPSSNDLVNQLIAVLNSIYTPMLQVLLPWYCSSHHASKRNRPCSCIMRRKPSIHPSSLKTL